ncbi:MAG: hypothetical protein AAGJ70_05690 [Pseudomonadota bacterium]
MPRLLANMLGGSSLVEQVFDIDPRPDAMYYVVTNQSTAHAPQPLQDAFAYWIRDEVDYASQADVVVTT